MALFPSQVTSRDTIVPIMKTTTMITTEANVNTERPLTSYRSTTTKSTSEDTTTPTEDLTTRITLCWTNDCHQISNILSDKVTYSGDHYCTVTHDLPTGIDCYEGKFIEEVQYKFGVSR